MHIIQKLNTKKKKIFSQDKVEERGLKPWGKGKMVDDLSKA